MPIDQTGATWTYEFTDEIESLAGYSAFETVEAKGPDPSRGEDAYLVVSHMEFVGGPWAFYQEDLQFWYQCDDTGVWIIGYTADLRWEFADGDAGSMFQLMEYDERPHVVPHEISLGDTWGGEYTGKWADEYANSGDVGGERLSEAVEAEAVSTDAGTFDALRIESGGPQTTAPHWRVEGIGLVLSSEYMLTDFVPGDPDQADP